MKPLGAMLRKKIRELLTICEAENDFWPNSRHFFSVGEDELAFEGIYLYLLERSDVWKRNHALIKSIKRDLEEKIDFDKLELTAVDDGMYDERRSTIEWRAEVVQDLEEKS